MSIFRKTLPTWVTKVLLLIVAVVVGFYVYDLGVQSNKAVSGLSSSTAIQDNLNNQNSAVQADWFYARELGVRFKLTADEKNQILTSSYSFDGSRLGGVDELKFSTVALAKLDSGCTASGGNPLGIVTRVKGMYPKDASVDNSAGVLVKQFDSFYIGYRSPQAVCSSNQNATQEQSLSHKAAMDLSKTLELI